VLGNANAVLDDIRAAGRIETLELSPDDTLADGEVALDAAEQPALD
jgi:hypothetical protein